MEPYNNGSVWGANFFVIFLQREQAHHGFQSDRGGMDRQDRQDTVILRTKFPYRNYILLYANSMVGARFQVATAPTCRIRPRFTQ